MVSGRHRVGDPYGEMPRTDGVGLRLVQQVDVLAVADLEPEETKSKGYGGATSRRPSTSA